ATAPPEIYTLSLHDALPIWRAGGGQLSPRPRAVERSDARGRGAPTPPTVRRSMLARTPRPGRATRATRAIRGASLALLLGGPLRSEEHTSELQSRSDLVCRL